MTTKPHGVKIRDIPNLTFFDMERLEGKIDVKGEDECWLWKLTLTRWGYGRFAFGRKQQCFAHRVVYKLLKGEIPDGLIVCHACDNPACCNPKHLYAGTFQDNSNDVYARGRGGQLKGEAHPESKLTMEIATKIRDAYKTIRSYKKLEPLFNVHRSTIARVITNKTWVAQ